MESSNKREKKKKTGNFYRKMKDTPFTPPWEQWVDHKYHGWTGKIFFPFLPAVCLARLGGSASPPPQQFASRVAMESIMSSSIIVFTSFLFLGMRLSVFLVSNMGGSVTISSPGFCSASTSLCFSVSLSPFQRLIWDFVRGMRNEVGWSVEPLIRWSVDRLILV